jgi:collagenase-like PrtC family protease
MKVMQSLELVCPAGTPASLRAAVDAGADSVYCGFRDETNARNFPGLNFSREELAHAVQYAHQRGARVFAAINTFPRAGAIEIWHSAVDDAARIGIDAIIVADIGLLSYAAERHPDLRRHLSVQAAAANPDAIRFYAETFGVKRVVLPRVVTVAEIAAINAEIPCETEVFVFGGLCVMAEGRCSLSSYVAGKSPNMHGVCSPASHVHYSVEGGDLVSRLGEFTIDRVPKDQSAPYPTICKGCFSTGSYRGHVFEDPVSLDAATLLPQLSAAGVTAIKIEGRQRSRAYVRDVVASFRRVLGAQKLGSSIPAGELRRLSEGQATTAGAYQKAWR